MSHEYPPVPVKLEIEFTNEEMIKLLESNSYEVKDVEVLALTTQDELPDNYMMKAKGVYYPPNGNMEFGRPKCMWHNPDAWLHGAFKLLAKHKMYSLIYGSYK